MDDPMKTGTNLLIVHAHDMGRYNSLYGHAIDTPNMRRLAEEGLVFRDAHCAAPTCSPSRAAMLTGVTAHEMGMLGLVHRGFTLNRPGHHLARRLAAGGYRTVRTGLQHEYDEAQVEVYDRVLEGKAEEDNRDLAAAASAEEFLSSNPEGPWFLWMGLFYPHREFLEPGVDTPSPAYIKVPDPLPDTPRNREDMAGYHATVAIADRALGRVMEALEASGQAENTLVMLVTDHGIAFPGMKCDLTAHGTGVTWVVRHPELPAGAASDALVSHLDLVPTVLDLLGLDIPEGLHGVSLRPVLERPETGSVRQSVFAEVNLHAGIEPKRGVRTQRYAYQRMFRADSAPVMANTDESPSKDTWLEAGWTERPEGRVRLYDLCFDPQERHNLAGDPDYADTLKDMEGLLVDWMERTNDPLLEGPLVIPNGTRTCLPGAPTPNSDVVELEEDMMVDSVTR